MSKTGKKDERKVEERRKSPEQRGTRTRDEKGTKVNESQWNTTKKILCLKKE